MKRNIRVNIPAYLDGGFISCDLSVDEGGRFFLSEAENAAIAAPFSDVLLPGFVDVHVHLREPGFSYKETIASGTAAAAHGGYTDVCSMPNLNPVPDCLGNLRVQTDIIARDACIRVHPYGSITVGQKGECLSDLAGLADRVVAFSDDGRGVQSDAMMESAMTTAKAVGKIIVAHCEVNDLLRGGYIHDGRYAAAHGHRGICSESEWRQIARDLELSAKTGCPYHVCHISTKESVDIIRRAKQSGVDVTCETGPHYLVLCEDDLMEDGRFKMNPPLRSAADRDALIEGLLDGTIDMIATDHAPHSAEEKSRGLEKSAMGVVGIETAFRILYTEFVRPGRLSFERLMDLLHNNAERRFGIGKKLSLGKIDDFTLWNLSECSEIDPNTFLSKGRATPFAGRIAYGDCRMTVCDGRVAYIHPNEASGGPSAGENGFQGSDV